MDEYLAFCEGALVGPANGKRQLRLSRSYVGLTRVYTGELERYFPLSQTSTSKSASAAYWPRADIRAMELPDGAELRPGEGYTLCDAGDMPEQYAAIAGRAAGWAGVREEYLREVVQSYERRLWRYWLRIRRGEEAEE